MIDIALAYNRYQFLGDEFLTWMWFLIENERELLKQIDPELAFLGVGNRIVLENRAQESMETVTIKGDDAGLEEGLLALRKGSLVTEMNLIYRSGDQEWRLNIKGESLDIASLKPPETAGAETPDDVEGAILEKVYLYEKVLTTIDNLYRYFIKLRVSDQWMGEIVPLLKNWIHK
jgi:hypothetical protein